ncbi:MAG: hypothetical protein H6733_03565 [Alphaproteobacteria bacterium]|nr:hypothetical protein [Alphaproteobacteria bacterium]
MGDGTLSGADRAWLALATCAYGILALAAWQVIEDAYISFRYAHHLASGLGLRFNPSEVVPVEGFSNLGIVLLAAAAERLGLSPERVVPAITLACGVPALAMVQWLARGPLGRGATATGLALVVLACCPSFVGWATSGLEPMACLLAFLVGTGLLAFGDSRAAHATAGLALGALAVLRTEGIAWTPVVAALAIAVRAAEGRPWRTPVARGAALALTVGLAVLAFRLATFGSLLSNVAVAKLGVPGLLARGLRYDLTFLLVQPWVPLALGGTVWGLWRTDRDRARGVWVLAHVAAVGAWAAVVGGDYMAWFRFLVPALPFAALALARLLDDVSPGARRLLAAVALAGAVLPAANVLPVPQALLRRLDYGSAEQAEGAVRFRAGGFARTGEAYDLEDRARVLGALTEPGDTVVTAAIGLAGYRNPDVELLDLCGLVTPEIARRRVARSHGDRAGHERCVGPRFFAERGPEVLAYDLVDPSDPERLAERLARWRETLPTTTYGPVLASVTDPETGRTISGVALRIAASPQEAAARWAALASP